MSRNFKTLRRTARRTFRLAFSFCLLVSPLLASNGFNQDCFAQRPNIILINLDDADTEMFELRNNSSGPYRNINAIADAGITFTNLHVTTPFCGPSRACLYRAQYAHNTGNKVNNPTTPSSNGFDGGMTFYNEQGYFQDDLGTWMKDAGYRTMLVGKYLHSGFLPIVPPGWDDFYSYLGARYWDTPRFINEGAPEGKFDILPPGRYRTTAEAADATRLIRRHVRQNEGQPFFLNLNPYGPHNPDPNSPGMVNTSMLNLWPGLRMPDSLALNEEDISDKVGYFKGLPRFEPEIMELLHARHRERALALKSCDNMIGSILRTLERLNLLDNTYILITSDNGFMSGHHRATGKGTPYDRATRVPLYVMGPGVPAGRKANHLMAHIDLGPTIVDLAGGQVPSFVDGISFKQLLTPTGIDDNDSFRNSVLIENWQQFNRSGRIIEAASNALRTTNTIYTEWANGDKDFFDLRFDPEQLNNAYSFLSPSTRESFASQLRTLKNPNQLSKARFSIPFEDFELLPAGMGLRGLAEDPIGVAHVRLAVYDIEREMYWNGQNWQPSFFLLRAELENPGGQITFWNYNQMPVGDDAAPGLKAAWVWSYDENFRHDSNTLAFFETE